MSHGSVAFGDAGARETARNGSRGCDDAHDHAGLACAQVAPPTYPVRRTPDRAALVWLLVPSALLLSGWPQASVGMAHG